MAKSGSGCGSCRAKSSRKGSSRPKISKAAQGWLDTIDHHCNEAHRPRLLSRWEVGRHVSELNTTSCVTHGTGSNKTSKPMPSSMIAELTNFCKDAPTLDAYRRFHEILRVATFNLRTTRKQLVKQQLTGGIETLSLAKRRETIHKLENHMMNWDWFRCILACAFVDRRIVRINAKTGPQYEDLDGPELCTDIDRIMMFHTIFWYAKNQPENMSTAFVDKHIGRSKEIHDPLTPEKRAYNTSVASNRMIDRLLRFETALNRREDLPLSRFHRKALETLAKNLFNLAAVANRVAFRIEKLLNKHFGPKHSGSGFTTGLGRHPKSSNPSPSRTGSRSASGKIGKRKVHTKKAKAVSKKAKAKSKKTKARAKKTKARAKKTKAIAKKTKVRRNKRGK